MLKKISTYSNIKLCSFRTSANLVRQNNVDNEAKGKAAQQETR